MYAVIHRNLVYVLVCILLFIVFGDAGVDLEKPVITTCFIGHTAFGMATAAELLGCPQVSVYYVS